MTAARIPLLAAVVLTLGILVGLCLLAGPMYPLHASSSVDFWYATTGVDLGGATKQAQALTVYDQGRFVYGSQYSFAEFPDRPYQTVSEEDVERDLPAVQRELARRNLLNDPNDIVAAGYYRWRNLVLAGYGGPGDRLLDLFNCIDAARLSNNWPFANNSPLGDFGPATDVIDFKQGLMHVSRAARLYWVCFVFEALFLSAVVWFAFWPYIRRYNTRRKLLHVAATPFLLFLPLWFGYCNPAGPAYPIGGILYPFVVVLSPKFINNTWWEFSLLSHLPQFFVVITQGRAVGFDDFRTVKSSIPYLVGPINAALISLALTAFVAAFHMTAFLICRNRVLRLARRGFPVLMEHDTKP